MEWHAGLPVVLYREGSDPETAEWRRICIKHDKRQPQGYSVEESSGFGKEQPLSPSILYSGGDLGRAENQGNAAIARLEQEGFAIYDPRTWRKP